MPVRIKYMNKMEKKGFDQYASQYDAWFLQNENVLLSEAKLVAYFLKDAGKILSVGCGSGLFESILKRDNGIIITNGIEPSVGMAEIARKRGVDVVIGTAEEADFGVELYDTILFNGTPSYITDLQKSFDKAHAALKPGGKIIVIDVPKESSYALLYNLALAVGTWDHPLLEGVKPANPYPIEFVKQANWRTTEEKKQTLLKAGFKDFKYAQTLTRHALYSDVAIEEPSEGYESGDYVAICAVK